MSGDLREVRRGRWTYGEHAGLNPGWRLDGTNLVLDRERQGGGWVYALWTDGRYGDPIDSYLDGAMEYVEKYLAPTVPASEVGR